MYIIYIWLCILLFRSLKIFPLTTSLVSHSGRLHVHRRWRQLHVTYFCSNRRCSRLCLRSFLRNRNVAREITTNWNGGQNETKKKNVSPKYLMQWNQQRLPNNFICRCSHRRNWPFFKRFRCVYWFPRLFFVLHVLDGPNVYVFFPSRNWKWRLNFS